MNLVRLHFGDGSVESFRPSGPAVAHFIRRRNADELVAITDAAGEPVSVIADRFRSVARWSQGRLNAERLARNIARFMAEEREALLGVDDLEEPFEHRPPAAWPLSLALVVLVVLAGALASSLGGMQ